MTEAELIERLKKERDEYMERSQKLKRENMQLRAEVDSIRQFAEATKAKAYEAVLAEAKARDRALDAVFKRLNSTIAMSVEQQHAVMEIFESKKNQKIGSNLASPS